MVLYRKGNQLRLQKHYTFLNFLKRSLTPGNHYGGTMSNTIDYDKLVRDRIPEIIKEIDKVANIEIVDKDTALNYLIKKIDEEKIELIEALETYKYDSAIEELADLLEIIHGIAYQMDLPFQELDTIRIKKKKKRGGFEDRIVLKSVVSEE